MGREFIDYTKALELKELGFDEPCFGYYDGNHNLQYMFNGYPESFSKRMMGVSDSVWVGWISAPTYSQAFRWFREKYELEGVTQQAEDFMWYKWVIYQYNENGKKCVADWYEYITYEEAELACLKQLIQIVKQK